jgi:transposase
MPHPAQQIVYAEYLKAIDEVESRIERLDKEIEAFAEISEQAPVIRALQSLKGVQAGATPNA